MSRKSTDYFIIHCTATKPSMDIGFEEVNRWHRERGFLSCGYHFIIRRNGVIEDGRTTDAVGAHCRGKNHNSIGIAMVGGVTQDDHTKAEDNFEGANLIVDGKNIDLVNEGDYTLFEGHKVNHYVTPVTSGRRKVLVLFYEYERATKLI